MADEDRRKIADYYGNKDLFLKAVNQIGDDSLWNGINSNYDVRIKDAKSNMYHYERSKLLIPAKKDTNISSSEQISTNLNESQKHEKSTINEVDKMKLIGRIVNEKTFYNFYPEYEFISGEWRKISYPKGRYPERGAITLNYNLHNATYSYITSINVDIDQGDNNFVKNIYLIETDEKNIKDNNTEKTWNQYQKKIELTDCIEDSIKLGDIIRPISRSNSQEKIYKIVTCLDEETYKNLDVDELLNLNTPIEIRESYYVNENDEVLLSYKHDFWGPFPVKSKEYEKDNKLYIYTDAEKRNYVFEYYSDDSLQKIEFGEDSRCKTDCVYVSGKPKFRDVITPEGLLNKAAKDNIKLDLAYSNPKEFAKEFKSSLLSDKIDGEFRKKRMEMLSDIIKDTHNYEEKIKELFSNSEDDEKYQDLWKEHEELKDKYEELNKKYNDLKSQHQSSGENSSADSEIEKLRVEIERLKKLEEKSITVEGLNGQEKLLTSRINEKNDELRGLERQIKEQKDEIAAYINSKNITPTTVAFDPYMSNLLIKKAAEYDSDQEESKYKDRKDKTQKITPCSFSDRNEILDEIVGKVQKKRNYKRNDIINIYISVVQNFITIFAGDPGIGKTSMCNIIADSLGLNSFGEDINRYVSVSVERGWSTKRDLIGYFNPLTKKYDKSSNKIYDSLKLLDLECDESKYPFLILLDEANLSPMEYYWADFMRLTDRNSENDCYIDIGTEKNIFVPETLRFLATINTDQTTEMLSPRMIDRAAIIKLPNAEVKEYNDDDTSNASVYTWKDLKNVFVSNSDSNIQMLNVLKNIYNLFEDNGMRISPRIEKAITDYVKVAQEIMENEAPIGTQKEVSKAEKATDYAIVQKLLPKINGSMENYGDFFDKLSNICNDSHLYMTNKEIETMKKKAKSNMGYCQFLG